MTCILQMRKALRLMVWGDGGCDSDPGSLMLKKTDSKPANHTASLSGSNALAADDLLCSE